MIQIQLNETINKRTDTDNLSKIYTFILDRYKKDSLHSNNKQ